MTLPDVLKELGLNYDGTYSRDGEYVVDLADSSDDFGKAYSTLDRNDDAEYMQENSLLTVDNASMYYRYKDYMINIIADFNNNHYKIVIQTL